MDKSNWISSYENAEAAIEKAVKANKEFTHAAFFSLGLAGVGAAVAASSRFEPVLAGGVSAVVTGLIMGTYFFMSKGKNNDIIDAKQRLLDKIYKLMPEQDQDFLEQNAQIKQKAIDNVQLLRNKPQQSDSLIINKIHKFR